MNFLKHTSGALALTSRSFTSSHQLIADMIQHLIRKNRSPSNASTETYMPLSIAETLRFSFLTSHLLNIIELSNRGAYGIFSL